jgi:hypothetical protein
VFDLAETPRYVKLPNAPVRPLIEEEKCVCMHAIRENNPRPIAVRSMVYREQVMVVMPEKPVTLHRRSLWTTTKRESLFHVVLCAPQLEVRHLVEPLALLVPLEGLEVDAVWLRLEAVEHADGNVKVSDLLTV